MNGLIKLSRTLQPGGQWLSRAVVCAGESAPGGKGRAAPLTPDLPVPTPHSSLSGFAFLCFLHCRSAYAFVLPKLTEKSLPWAVVTGEKNKDLRAKGRDPAG